MESQENDKQHLKVVQSDSSQNAQTKMESSAFEFQSEVISTNYTWNIIDQDENDCAISGTFGSKKTLFYLTLKECRNCDECTELALNLHQNSTEMSSFVEMFRVNFKDNFEKAHFKKGLTVDTPLVIKHIQYSPKEVKVEMTFVEKVDKWNSIRSTAPINHAEMLCRQIANMSYIPADVTLKTVADGQLFPAHKLILKLRSSVFAAMFSGPFVENQVEKPIEIFEISGQAMEGMLAYIYCRPFDGWKAIAGELAVAADMYNIQPLYQACVDSLYADITVESAAKNFYFANLLNAANVRKIARFIDKREKQVKQSKGWKEIAEDREEWLEKQLSGHLSEVEDKTENDEGEEEEAKDEDGDKELKKDSHNE